MRKLRIPRLDHYFFLFPCTFSYVSNKPEKKYCQFCDNACSENGNLFQHECSMREHFGYNVRSPLVYAWFHPAELGWVERNTQNIHLCVHFKPLSISVPQVCYETYLFTSGVTQFPSQFQRTLLPSFTITVDP